MILAKEGIQLSERSIRGKYRKWKELTVQGNKAKRINKRGVMSIWDGRKQDGR